MGDAAFGDAEDVARDEPLSEARERVRAGGRAFLGRAAPNLEIVAIDNAHPFSCCGICGQFNVDGGVASAKGERSETHRICTFARPTRAL